MIVACVAAVILAPFAKAGWIDMDSFFARLYAYPVLLIYGIRVQTEGSEHFPKDRPFVLVANHQSAMDMATFGTLYPKRMVCIGKKEIAWIPFFNVMFWAGGNIFLNRQNRRQAVTALDQVVEAVKGRGVSVWIFPEGTRNRTSQPLIPFKKGAFHIAVAAQVPIVPVVSSRLRHLVSWSDGRAKSGTVRLKILPPIETRGLMEKDVDALMGRVRDQMERAILDISEKQADAISDRS